MIIKLWGIISDTLKESIRKFTFITFFILSTLFLLLFLLFINIDVVNGTLSLVKMFGEKVTSRVSVDQLLTTIESAFAITLYYVILLFAIFTISNIIPHLLEKGRVDIYISKPIARIHLLFGKTIGSMIIVVFNTFYLLIGMWLILLSKVGTFHIEFIYSGFIIIYMFFVLFSLNLLLGILIKNSLVSIMVCYFVIILDAMLYGIVSGLNSDNIILNVLYWSIPKVTGLSSSIKDLIETKSINDWTFYITSGGFAVVIYSLSAFLFKRKDY